MVLHNTADIPIDFYLPSETNFFSSSSSHGSMASDSGVSTPGSRMVGLGLDWYPQLDMALMGLSVLVFLSAHRSRQWVFFGVAVLAMNYLALYDIVWHQLSKQQYLVIMVGPIGCINLRFLTLGTARRDPSGAHVGRCDREFFSRHLGYQEALEGYGAFNTVYAGYRVASSCRIRDPSPFFLPLAVFFLCGLLPDYCLFCFVPTDVQSTGGTAFFVMSDQTSTVSRPPAWLFSFMLGTPLTWPTGHNQHL